MPIKKRSKPSKPPAKARLGKGLIESLPVLEKDYLVSDTELPRLKVKVTPSGNRSFLIRYRNKSGNERKFKLGDFPDLNAATARTVAAKYLNNIAAGVDPAADRALLRSGMTLNELFQRFVDEYAALHLRPSTIYGYQQIHGSLLSNALGKRSIVAIERRDFVELHAKLRNTPYQANRLIALVRRLYNWAMTNGLYDDRPNPTLGIRPYRESTTERLLNQVEMDRLAESLEFFRSERPDSEAALNSIVFMFFTACRRGEAFRMRWEHVDFERRTISFIGAKSGDRKQYMSHDLLDWLATLREKSESEFLFPGRVEGKPLHDIKRIWGAVKERAGLGELRLHDIRHNVISNIAADYDLATAQSVAGHKSPITTGRYIHAQRHTTAIALDASGKRVREGLLQKRTN